jgi:hypothetical protein
MNEKAFNDLVEDLVDFCNAVESAVVNLRRQLKPFTETEPKVRILEDRFNVLKWEDEKGARLGIYQVAYKKHNLADSWQHVFNILKANNSLIADPFHGKGYRFRYWIYPEKYHDRIYRKKLTESSPE